MGTDCSITLPASARLRDVADVLAALSGVRMKRVELQGGGFYAATDVKAKPASDSMPECAFIDWQGANGERHHVMYHFEFDEEGNHGLLPHATPFWIACAKRLVKFFGGSADYNDCDKSDCDIRKPTRKDISASGGAAWDNFQTRKLNVQPLTDDEIETARKFAAY